MNPANPNLPQSLRSKRPLAQISTGPEVAELESIDSLEQLDEIAERNNQRSMDLRGPR